MKFVKKENGNILITNDVDVILKMIQDVETSLEILDDNDTILIRQNGILIFQFQASDVTAYRIMPAAQIPFSDTAADFINILAESFFLNSGADIPIPLDVNIVSPDPLPVSGSFSVQNGIVSTLNATSTPLGVGGNYTGGTEDCSAFSAIVVSCKSDQPGILYVEFSPDGINWYRTVTYKVTNDTSENHRLTVTNKFFRVVFDNTSGNAQTYFFIQVLLGEQTQLSGPLNRIIQQDADSIVVRPIDFNLLVAWNRYQNHQAITKDGLNPDIDGGTSPEDLWTVGGLYTGFVTTIETATFVSTDAADTGMVYFSYLESPGSTEYSFGSIALNGLTPVTTAFNVWRCNFMYFDNGSTFNAGTISMYQTLTTANIFCTIDSGFGQSFCSAFTTPVGMTAFIDYFSGGIKGGISATLDGFLYWKKISESPQLRYSYTLNSQSINFDDVDYLFPIPEQIDIVPRIISTNGSNNVSAQVRYRIILVKN